jgi:hypothetical protein
MNAINNLVKHPMLLCTLSLFLTISIVTGSENTSTVSENSLTQMMIALMEDLRVAAVERDVDKILSFCDNSPEFFYIGDGKLHNYDQFVKAEYSGFSAVQRHQLSWDALHVKTLGDDVVAAFAPFHQVITDTNGIETRLKGGVSWIAINKGGILKLRYGQSWHEPDTLSQ